MVGISTLHAQASRVCDTGELICAMLDARKREVYAALFRRVNGNLMRLSDDGVMSMTNAIEMIQSARQNDGCTVIGDGAQAYDKVLLQSLGARLRIAAETECLRWRAGSRSSLSALGRLQRRTIWLLLCRYICVRRKLKAKAHCQC